MADFVAHINEPYRTKETVIKKTENSKKTGIIVRIKEKIKICEAPSPRHNTIIGDCRLSVARWLAYGSKVDIGGGDINYYSCKANESTIDFEHDEAWHSVNSVVTAGGDDAAQSFRVTATYTAPANIIITGLRFRATYGSRANASIWSSISESQVLGSGKTYEINWTINFT